MKYTPQQIQFMAMQFFAANAAGDVRAELLIDAMRERTGKSRDDVLAGIHHLAMGMAVELAV